MHESTVFALLVSLLLVLVFLGTTFAIYQAYDESEIAMKAGYEQVLEGNSKIWKKTK